MQEEVPMSEQIPIGAFDRLLLRSESQQTPAHTASLNVYRLPKGGGPNFLRDLFAHLRSFPVTAAPFNYVLNKRTGSRPTWRVVKDVELDYHLRHSALPLPGGERELGELVSRLHSHQLDFSRPLWEFHLIEGLENHRFATYMKMHHALADGGAVVKIVTSAMSEKQDDSIRPPPWAVTPKKATAGADTPVPSKKKSQAATDVDLKVGLWRALTRTAAAQIARRDRGLVGPYACPKCILNGPLGPARRYATQSYKIERLKAVAHEIGGTINDVFLAICGTAVRRYLLELNELPEKSVIASVPVALDRKAEETLGSVVGLIAVSLATDIEDPKARIAAIIDSSRQAKENLFGMPKWKIDIYNAIVMLPFARGRVSRGQKPTGLMGNFACSNVPGSRKRLYFYGAEVEAMYPCAVIMQGYALNITARGYADTINLGFLGCRDLLPKFQRLAVYTGDALAELEQLYGLQSPEARLSVARAS
jgi:diacylglycerol O-acyltransferase / wax synthase